MAQFKDEDYRSLFENSPDGEFVCDEKGNFLLVNKKLCEILGYTEAEFLGMTLFDTVIQTEVDLFYKRLIDLKKNKRAFVERTLRGKHDNLVYAQIVYKLIGPKRLHAVVHLLDTKKGVIKQLAENEQRFQQIAEHIRDVFFLVELETYKFLYVSPGYEKIWGNSCESLLTNSTSWLSQIHPDDIERMSRLFQEHLKTGVLDANYRIIKTDGSIRWIHARTFPIYNEAGKLYRLAGMAEDISDQMKHNEERLKYFENLKRGYQQMIAVMSAALEKRDAYTTGHQNNVLMLATAIAEEMGLAPLQIEGLGMAAQVHDIGKIAIPIEILTKPGKLSPLEYELIKTHVEVAYHFFKDIDFPWPIADIIIQHHERLNGSGYPKGLKGDQIRLEARILAVADVVDAMASHRPYRPAKGLEAAMAEIRKNKGILFDPRVVDACDRLYKENRLPVGFISPANSN